MKWTKNFKAGNDCAKRAATAHYKKTIRLTKRRRADILPMDARKHRMANEPLPFPRTRSSTKLGVIDPDTGHTAHGQQALRAWRSHMIRHLTDQPITATRKAPATLNQQPDAETRERSDHPSDTSPTLTSGSDTPEAMHIRRARTGPGRRPLLEQASSDDECEHPNTTSTNVTPSTQPSSTNSTRQSTLTEFFSDTPASYDDAHHTKCRNLGRSIYS